VLFNVIILYIVSNVVLVPPCVAVVCISCGLSNDYNKRCYYQKRLHTTVTLESIPQIAVHAQSQLLHFIKSKCSEK